MRNIRIYPCQVITKAENLNANEPIPITDDMPALLQDLEQEEVLNDFEGFSTEDINISKEKKNLKPSVEPDFEGFTNEDINIARRKNVSKPSGNMDFEGFSKEGLDINKNKLNLLEGLIGKKNK